MHDILIFIVIGVIIVFQIYFFRKNAVAIKNYKESLLQVKDLEIIEDGAIDNKPEVQFFKKEENFKYDEKKDKTLLFTEDEDDDLLPF